MPDQSTTASRSDGTERTDSDSHRRDDEADSSRRDTDGPGSRGRDHEGHDPDRRGDDPDADSSDTDGNETDPDTDSDSAGVDTRAFDAADTEASADAPDADTADANTPVPDADDADTPDSGPFRKLDGVEYDRVNDLLDGYVDFTAREWAVARLCADFRTGTGVPTTRVGEHLPEMVPFVTGPYTRQEVYGAKRSFEDRVRRAAATFLYGASSGFLAAEEVDDVLYEATEVARFLLEVEGTSLSLDDERAVEERTVEAMRSVHEASLAVRYDECPDCGARLGGED